MAIRRKISESDGQAALSAVRTALAPVIDNVPAETLLFALDSTVAALPRGVRATAVRYGLEELATLAPGNSVEVRVPPYGVTQCVAGPRHTRGTPPSVVETSPALWLAMVTGAMSWEQALASGDLSASGERSDLGRFFPLF